MSMDILSINNVVALFCSTQKDPPEKQLVMSYISYYTALIALFAPLLLLVAIWSLFVVEHDKHVRDDTPLSDANSTGERTSEVSKVSNVPDDWFTSDEIFQLERRAIFSNVS